MRISDTRKFIFNKQKEIIFVLVFIVSLAWLWATDIPKREQDRIIIEIEEGKTLKEISQVFKDNDLIRSKILFDAIVILSDKDSKIIFGEYLFEGRIPVFKIVERITSGDYGIPAKTVFLKEGLTLKEMAFTLSKMFPSVHYDVFIEKTEGLEGHFFPDTYIFPENVDTDTVIRTLQNNFQTKIKSIDNIIKSSKHSLDEIIVMASIVEKEATAESRQEVANILWHRLEIGMALQVDATFVYERGLGTFDLTKADLKKDSPYNTYVNKELPPTAISNPGIESIIAAANPQPTKNLYFLTGHDGEMYYAETFEEHKKNKTKYLN